MRELSDAVATADGIDFAYQVSAEKLASQLETIDKVDAKLGVLIGALVTLASLYTATAKSGIAALLLLIRCEGPRRTPRGSMNTPPNFRARAPNSRKRRRR